MAAVTYPADLVPFVDPVTGTTTPGHASLHTAYHDALEALAAQVGLPSAPAAGSLLADRVRRFGSVAELRASTASQWSGLARTLGCNSAEDGAGGPWIWRSDSVLADNTGTVVKPTAVVGAGRFHRLVVDSTVNVRWFGATGNGFHQRADGVCFQDAALTIPATDDTAAFRSAWDFCIGAANYAYLTPTANNVTFGWMTRPWRLHIPGGSYYVASATAMFSSARVALGGAQTGMMVTGDGKLNSIIRARQVSPAAGDWIIDIRGYYASFSRFGIWGCTGSEQLIDYSGGAASQDTMFEQLWLNSFKVMFQAGNTVNSDKTRWVDVSASSATTGSSLFRIAGNTQSVAHMVTGCSWGSYGAGSKMFDLTAGGAIAVFGSSLEVHDGATMFAITGTGATLGGQLVPNVQVHACKTECHGSSRYADLTYGSVYWSDTNTSAIIADTGNHKWVLRQAGKLMFHRCIPGSGKFGYVLTDTSATDMSVTATECDLPANWLTSFHEVFTDAGLSTPYAGIYQAARPVIRAAGCRDLDSNPFAGSIPTVVAANGEPYAHLGYRQSGELQEIRHTAYTWPSYGLPDTGGLGVATAARIVIPANCTIAEVGIVKSGASSGGTTQTWEVRDLDGTLLVSLTAAAATAPAFASATMARSVSSTNSRTLELKAAAGSSNHYAAGHFFVRYR